MVGDNDAGGRRDLLPGGAKLRHQPAVGPAPADPGARRQPGNGGPAGRGDRRGPRPADQGALRPVLGACSRSATCSSSTSSPSSPSSSAWTWPSATSGSASTSPSRPPPFGLVAITASGSFRRWERFMLLFVVANFLVIPLAVFSHPHARPGRARPGRARDRRRCQLDVGPAHHRHRGHDGGPLAAVLPAVQHRRQADHPALHQLRAGRHRARLPRHRRRRLRHGGHVRLRLLPHRLLRPFHRRRRGGPRPRPPARATPPAPSTPWCCSTPPSSGRRR